MLILYLLTWFAGLKSFSNLIFITSSSPPRQYHIALISALVMCLLTLSRILVHSYVKGESYKEHIINDIFPILYYLLFLCYSSG